MGRKAIGYEIEEKYCELIASRLAQQSFDFGAIVTEKRCQTCGWLVSDEEWDAHRENEFPTAHALSNHTKDVNS